MDMIHYIKGNIFDSDAEALVNTVNTVGVMGKGIALQFKKAFPANYKAYKNACKNGLVQIGQLFVSEDQNLEQGKKIIINFPTKKHWRNTSEYEYVEKGLEDLVRIIQEKKINSIAIPPLGAGNGGLHWEKVKDIIVDKLQDLNIRIDLYEPNNAIVEKLKKERVKLTKARALLLFVLYDLVKNGEYVSEFSSEKVCYFLQHFGAKNIFKLDYQPNFYGPYSGKVRFLLNVLSGSYILGYSDMNKKPFEPLTMVSDAYEDVYKAVIEDDELRPIATKTIEFLDGFYSDFSLELLSSVDYISRQKQTLDRDIIATELESWNNRKKSMFSNPRYLAIAIRHLEEYQPSMAN